jgi:hypothetical protein
VNAPIILPSISLSLSFLLNPTHSLPNVFLPLSRELVRQWQGRWKVEECTGMAVGDNRAMAARELSADIKQCGDEERPP